MRVRPRQFEAEAALLSAARSEIGSTSPSRGWSRSQRCNYHEKEPARFERGYVASIRVRPRQFEEVSGGLPVVRPAGDLRDGILWEGVSPLGAP